MGNSCIDVKDLSFCYEKGTEILHGISFHASGTDSIGIIGANGAGKSTLLKLLVGLDLGFTGSIQVGEIPLEQKTLAQIRAMTGYVFQDSDSQLFMPTVYEDVAFAPRNYGLPEDEVQRRVEHALRLTGIIHLKDKQIYKMSGGEKKLASIATILSMTPDIILMDEPSIALDPRNRKNLIRLLNSFRHLKIIASHDLDMVWDTCSRAILLADGTVIANGAAKELLRDEKLLKENGLELPLRFSEMGIPEP